MATTAQDVALSPFLMDDAVISLSGSGIASTGTVGDWMIASAQWAIPAVPGTIGSPAFKVSAFGVLLNQNPTFNSLGQAINNSALSVLRHGVLRVSAGNSGTARTIPIGAHVYPNTTGSGIVGQTGATGVGAIWLTAPPQGLSANPTGALASGVGIVIGHPVGGDSGLGQIDIVFSLATNVGYF